MAQHIDYTMAAGDSRIVEIGILDEDGDNLDLTELDITAQYAISRGAGAAILVSKSQTLNEIRHGDDDHILAVTLDAVDTASLAPGIYYHEMQLTEDGQDYTVIRGHVRILGGVIS